MPYPSLLTGTRANHRGFFEAAIRYATGNPHAEGHEQYDLIVAGTRISEFAAAHFYRAHAPADPHSR
jgi:hypothetical protein